MTGTTAATGPTLRGLARELHQAADGLAVDITDDGVTADQLLDHLRCLAAVFGATDAGNAKADKEPGPLRPHRTAVFHALADKGVTRKVIADAAGVTENAIGFAFKGTRRGRNGSAPAATPAPADGKRKRRPRPG